jgi:hypothetical protein
VQHAFDNWDAGPAKRLPACVKAWNDSKKGPRVVLGSPEPAFRDIEARFGRDLPVHRGEWGGQWDAIRASSPVWTWRVREAMKTLPADAPFARKADLATAMEHSQGLGPGWPEMMTADQTRTGNREVADLFARAAGKDLAEALPPGRPMPTCDEDCKDVWKAHLGRINPRVRCGRGWLGPFVVSEAPELPARASCGINRTEYGCDLTLARRDLPGHERGAVSVVIEFPLKAAAKALRIAPERSAPGRAGAWLRGAPPSCVVAPAGLRLTGLAVPMRVTSPVVFSWCLVPDKDDENLTWLQGNLLGQSTSCIFKGKTPGTLPWDDVYPGEPDSLRVQVFFEIIEEK